MDSVTTAFEWLIGVLVTVGLAIAGAFVHVYGKMGAMENNLASRMDDHRDEFVAGDKQLWDAHNVHVTRTSEFRENVKGQIGSLATRQDIDALRKDVAEGQRSLLTEITRIFHVNGNGNGNGNH